MKKIIKGLLSLLSFVCIIAGASFLLTHKNVETEKRVPASNQKASALQHFLERYQKPSRIEVTSLTQRFAADAEDIKKIQMPLDQQSRFYIAITLFTDETDNEAPLVAQIKFMDATTENKLSEENINLD